MAEPEQHGDRTLMREKAAATTELRLQLAEKAVEAHEERLDALESEVKTKIAYVYGIMAAVSAFIGLIVWAAGFAE
jgi:hypothetical protein